MKYHEFALYANCFAYRANLFLSHADLTNLTKRGCVERSSRILSAMPSVFSRMAHASDSDACFVSFVRSV